MCGVKVSVCACMCFGAQVYTVAHMYVDVEAQSQHQVLHTIYLFSQGFLLNL